MPARMVVRRSIWSVEVLLVSSGGDSSRMRSVDFSPSAAAALFMPDIHTIRLHDIVGHSS